MRSTADKHASAFHNAQPDSDSKTTCLSQDKAGLYDQLGENVH